MHTIGEEDNSEVRRAQIQSIFPQTHQGYLQITTYAIIHFQNLNRSSEL